VPFLLRATRYILVEYTIVPCHGIPRAPCMPAQTASLLWVHGKRLSCPHSNMAPSDIILRCGFGKGVIWYVEFQRFPPSFKTLEAMCDAGNASVAYIYFDFRDTNKQCLHGLVPFSLNSLFVRILVASSCGNFMWPMATV
jgi:hypothetical protein